MSTWLKGLLVGLAFSAKCVFAFEQSFSVGASVGGAFYREPFVSYVAYSNNVPLTQKASVGEFWDSDLIWGFLGGYEISCLGWIFGAEANINWYELDKTHPVRIQDAIGFNPWGGLITFERGPVVALVGRIGYKIAPYFHPYMRAGVETSKDTLTATYTSRRLILSPNTASVELEQRSYRWVVGLGAEFPLCMKTRPAIRLEYNYHAWGEKMEANANLGLLPPFFTTSAHPKIHSGTASIVWHFGNRHPKKRQ